MTQFGLTLHNTKKSVIKRVQSVKFEKDGIEPTLYIEIVGSS
jgi:hypothetical protein